MMNDEKLIPGGIAFALMTQRKELLGLAMRGLRKQAEEGTLTGEPLGHVLNALEQLCEQVIEERERRYSESDEDAEV